MNLESAALCRTWRMISEGYMNRSRRNSTMWSCHLPAAARSAPVCSAADQPSHQSRKSPTRVTRPATRCRHRSRWGRAGRPRRRGVSPPPRSRRTRRRRGGACPRRSARATSSGGGSGSTSPPPCGSERGAYPGLCYGRKQLAGRSERLAHLV